MNCHWCKRPLTETTTFQVLTYEGLNLIQVFCCNACRNKHLYDVGGKQIKR